MTRRALRGPLLALCVATAWAGLARAQEADLPRDGEEAVPAAPAPAAPSVLEEGEDEEPPPPPPSDDAPILSDDTSASSDGDGGFAGVDTEWHGSPPRLEQGLVADSLVGPVEEEAGTGERTSAVGLHWRLAGLDETEPVFALSRGGLRLGLVGSMQLLAVPFIQDPWASLESGSVANVEGFRLRRARLGLAGRLASWVELELRLELTSTGADILDASVTFVPHELARITAGAFKVPFSGVMMQGSEYQSLVQRPYAVRSISPDRSLGVQVSGTLPWLSYFAGVFNGGGDYYRGDNNEGMLYAARLVAHPFGPLPPGEITPPDGIALQVAGSYYFNQDATGDRHAAGAELAFRWAGLSLLGEFLWSTFAPTGRPTTAEGVEYGHTERMGWFAEAGYFVLPRYLQVVVRYEANRILEAIEVQDLNDLWAISAAVNGYLLEGRLKLSIQYEHRHEWFDTQVPNDYLVLQLQGRI